MCRAGQKQKKNVPLGQNVDNLLAHDERRVVQDVRHAHIVFGDGDFAVEKGLVQSSKTKVEGKLEQQSHQSVSKAVCLSIAAEAIEEEKNLQRH